ncbi:hypothetical protein Halru_1628 [Halovivax ruber XH-70]|uniref:BioF2-like acetyltransferase domain-containing protein n=1 Tax=Halovivax ruber (strain DSM 18193 / JCM 13892 / XH-70) TaxID=797302 RepID=L0I9E9_HALRX|nr:GNAT family N-acetyltransferase [Halovivax ruber]AGB16235.1 hypothetical protein Halru_1628 [Halovivax ruber XH-70]
MSVDIRSFDLETEPEEWNRLVDRAHRSNPFYRAEALALQATETETTVHALAGFKGEEPVGLFPAFELTKGPFAAVFSPAPQSWSCYLGPVVHSMSHLKQRKADRRLRSFVDGCLEWLEDACSPVYWKVTTAGIDDLRPFTWNGFDVSLQYTYVVDLEDSPEAVRDRFSSDARRNVQSVPDGVSVTVEGPDAIDSIVEQVATRYEKQGRPFHLEPSYVRALYDALPAGAIRPYVCRVDGEFCGGILVLESDDTRFRWQGGVKLEDVDVPVNDLLDWRIIADGIDSAATRYDLVGAGVPAINRYKAKFNPRLETHHTITSGTFGIDHLVERYEQAV